VTKLRPAYAMRGIAPQGPGISRTMRVGEVANRSGGKSGIIGRERVMRARHEVTLRQGVARLS